MDTLSRKYCLAIGFKIAVLPEMWLNLELCSWFHFVLEKGIAAVENLRYLVEMCRASIILSEQVWVCWNSIGRSRTDVDDEQRTGHENRFTADENTPRATAIMEEKCCIKLTDIDAQVHISVGAARSTDRTQVNHTRLPAEGLSKSDTALLQLLSLSSIWNVTAIKDSQLRWAVLLRVAECLLRSWQVLS